MARPRGCSHLPLSMYRLTGLWASRAQALVMHLQESHVQVGATTVAAAETPATTGARTDHPQLGSSLWLVMWLFFCVFKCSVYSEGRGHLLAKRTTG